MKRLFPFLTVLIFMCLFGSSQQSFNFAAELANFTQSGMMSEALLDEVANLDDSQVTELINAVQGMNEATKKAFWDSWKTMDASKKTSLWRGMDEATRSSFLEEVSEEKGVSYQGFDASVSFGGSETIGNRQVYMSMEKVDEYNKEHIDDPIIAVQYSSEGDVRSIIISKKSGSKAEIKVPKGENGFYFDPSTNSVSKIKDDGTVDTKNPQSGVWNGKGFLTIDATSDDLKISLDFVKDLDGNVLSKSLFSQFTTSQGTKYSVLPKEISEKDEQGNKKTLYEKGTIILDEEGNEKELSFIRMDGNDYSGYFGESVKMFHDVDDYNALSDEEKANLGSYAVIDKERGIIKGDLVRRSAGGVPIANIAESLSALEEAIPEDVRTRIAEVMGETAVEACGFLVPGMDSELINQITESDYFQQQLQNLEENVANDANIAEVIDQLHDSVGLIEKNPLLAESVVNDRDFLDLELKNSFAKSIKEVDLDAGSLSIYDNTGKKIEVIRRASHFNYYLNPQLNAESGSLSGINFVLANEELPNQKIVIRSYNGKLYAYDGNWGDLTTLGEDEFIAIPHVTAGPRGGIDLSNSPQMKPEGMIEIGLENERSVRAKQLRSDAISGYNSLRSQLASDGYLSKEDLDQLKQYKIDATVSFYRELAIGDSAIYMNTIGRQANRLAPREFLQVAQQLQSINVEQLASSQQQRNLDQILLRTIFEDVYNDPVQQDAFVQMGLTDKVSVLREVQRQVDDVASFIQSNAQNGQSLKLVSSPDTNLVKLRIGSNELILRPGIGTIVNSLAQPMIISGAVNQNSVSMIPITDGGRLLDFDTFNVPIDIYAGRLLGNGNLLDKVITANRQAKRSGLRGFRNRDARQNYVTDRLVDSFYSIAKPQVVDFFFSKYLPNPNLGN